MTDPRDGTKEARQDYVVGYCRPPKHTRFKPGHSGNRKGRPRGAKSLKTDLSEEANERIRIPSGGKSKFVTKQRATVKQLHAKALAGDSKAMNTLLNLYLRLLGEDAEINDVELSEEEIATLEFALARRKKRNEGGAEGVS